MSFKQPIIRLFILTSLLFVVSCSSSSSPTTTTPASTVTKPKKGSTYSDSTYTKDTTFANVHSTGALVTYTLIDTNATFQSKLNGNVVTTTNVYVFASTVDTIYQHFETNGDVSVYVTFAAGSFTVGSEWVTFPFASQSTSNIPTFKAVVIDTVTITGTVQGSGTGTSLVKGQTLTTEIATMTVDASSNFAGHVPATVTLSFAPSIGFVTHQEIKQQAATNTTLLPKGGTDKFLVDYSLK